MKAHHINIADMKKEKISFLLFSLFICLIVKADKFQSYLTEDDLSSFRIVKAVVCVQLENLADYPDISVIGLPKNMGYKKSNSAFEFKSGASYLIQRFCPITIYAINREYLKVMGIKNIDWENDKHVIKSNLIMDAKKCNMETPIIMVQLNYKIAGFLDSRVVIYKSSETVICKDIKPNFVQNYGYPGDSSKLRQKF